MWVLIPEQELQEEQRQKSCEDDCSLILLGSRYLRGPSSVNGYGKQNKQTKNPTGYPFRGHGLKQLIA